MSNAKHTPGPWTFSQNHRGEFCINGAPATIADSRLLAMAPELLDAAENMFEFFRVFDGPEIYAELMDETLGANSYSELAKVLAKIKGESSDKT